MISGIDEISKIRASLREYHPRYFRVGRKYLGGEDHAVFRLQDTEMMESFVYRNWRNI